MYKERGVWGQHPQQAEACAEGKGSDRASMRATHVGTAKCFVARYYVLF